MQFRKDINGLRAIAVIAVVIFHFNNSWIPGGFAGVDVFFVISGYLMTGIVFDGFDKDNFSILRFYVARANRIIPALAVLCLVLISFGWLFLSPIDYSVLGNHILSSVGFYSNIVYWGESGYFDAASHEKWLLHTWSLSTEWQFYILYPLVLVVMRKFMSLNVMKLMVLLGAVFGFAFSVVATYMWPDPAYFLLPARAWEMMLGGGAFLFSFNINEKNKKVLEWAGLGLIVGSYFFVSENNLWPGYLAIFPVLGTFFVIQAQRSNSFIANNIVFQKLGLWSYSIYLWHWIVVVVVFKYSIDINIWLYLLMVMSFGCISYLFVEKNFSRKSHIFFLLAVALSFFIIMTDGVKRRVSEKYQLNLESFHEKYYGGAGYTVNQFIYINSNENDYDFIFSGDSYALQYAKAIDDSSLKVAGLFDHGCIILPTYSIHWKGKEDTECSGEYEDLKSKLFNNNKPLFLAHSWDRYRHKLIKKNGSAPIQLPEAKYTELIISELNKLVNDNGLNRQYFILGVPQRPVVNAFDCLSRNELLGFKLFDACNESQIFETIDINNALKKLADNYSGVYFIDPNDFLCKEKQCLTITNGEPVYSDRSHLSIYGASIVFDGILDLIGNVKSDSIDVINQIPESQGNNSLGTYQPGAG